MITSVLKTLMQKNPEWNSGDGKRSYSCQFYVSGIEHYLKSQQSGTPRRAYDWSSAPPWFYPEVWKKKKERGTSIQDYSISDMVELNGAFIDTAMITISVNLTNKKKWTKPAENVVANVKYAVSNITLCRETFWSFGQP